MKQSKLLLAFGLLAFACSTNQESTSTDSIAGLYAREYSFKVVNAESGAEVGMRTVRDTIFVRTVGNEYEVSNRKWRKNDYDTEGWQSMEHSDDRPMSTYRATYIDQNGSLTTQQSSMAPTLYFDASKQSISKSADHSQLYLRVK